MSIVYNDTLKDARLDLVTTALDVSAPGSIKIFESDGTTLLAQIPLANPAAAGASGGVLTLTAAGMTATAGASGTAAKASLLDGAGTVVASGLTVGVGTGDIQLSSVGITIGDTVTLTSATITHG